MCKKSGLLAKTDRKRENRRENSPRQKRMGKPVHIIRILFRCAKRRFCCWWCDAVKVEERSTLTVIIKSVMLISLMLIPMGGPCSNASKWERRKVPRPVIGSSTPWPRAEFRCGPGAKHGADARRSVPLTPPGTLSEIDMQKTPREAQTSPDNPGKCRG